MLFGTAVLIAILAFVPFPDTAALADVTVPAGTYRAIAGEVTIRAIGHGGSRDLTTIRYWYAPAVNRFVKYHYDSQSDCTVLESEMVSHKPAK